MVGVFVRMTLDMPLSMDIKGIVQTQEKVVGGQMMFSLSKVTDIVFAFFFVSCVNVFVIFWFQNVRCIRHAHVFCFVKKKTKVTNRYKSKTNTK